MDAQRKPIAWGDLRRTEPLTRSFGFDRGQPVDRYYIERFLHRHRGDIRGRTLEIGDANYTHRFGEHRVTKGEIYDRPGNPKATLTGDLGGDSGLPDSAFDCIIVTQTLLFVYDLKCAVNNLRAALKPGAVLLLTVPGISQIVREDMDREGDFWRFTTRSLQCLFADGFADLTIQAYGNVLASVAFLHGLAAEDLSPEELDHPDPDYELLLALRARREQARSHSRFGSARAPGLGRPTRARPAALIA